jgi:hypothetical protein
MADLAAGTFVLFSSGDVDDLGEVCCIVDCGDPNGDEEQSDMKVNVFRELGNSIHIENVREVTDPTLRFVPEVVQTLEVRSISPKEIKDVAFVFKTSVLLERPQYHAVQGISNVFHIVQLSTPPVTV